MIAIRFTDKSQIEEGVRLFQQYNEAVSVGDPNTYLVTEQGIRLLEQAHIPFERVENTHVWLTDDIFADMRRGFADRRQGRVTSVSEPLSVKKLAEIARRKGLK